MLPGGTDERTNEQGKIELLSQWKLEAEFRNCNQHSEYQRAENRAQMVGGEQVCEGGNFTTFYKFFHIQSLNNFLFL